MNKDTPDDSPADEPEKEILSVEEDTRHSSELAAIESVDARDPELIDIESREAAATNSILESIDPDKEIIFKRKLGEPKTIWWKQKRWFIPIGVTVIVLLLLAIPPIRYVVFGWVWRQPVNVAIYDSTTKVPVPDADVTIDGVTQQTNGDGIAQFSSLALGQHNASVIKANYKAEEQRVTVDVWSANATYKLAADATGRQIAVKVTDRISGEPIVGAELSSKGVRYGKSDNGGMASIVVPVKDAKLEVNVSAGTYNVLSTTITPQIKSVSLVPTGSMYFLSKQSGKIDVVKTNLDGSDRAVIVAGTGSENDRTTSLLAARDWQYAILKTKRLPNKPGDSLYILNTSKDSYDIMNDSDATFTPIGWMGHKFLYYSQKNNQYWQLKSAAIKSYDADSGVTTTIDENNTDPASTPQSGSYELLDNFYITENAFVYTKVWTSFSTGYAQSSTSLDNKQSTIVSVKPDGTSRKVLKSYAAPSTNSLSAKLYLPKEVYVKKKGNETPPKSVFSEYEDGAFKDNISAVDNFDNADYPTYIVSPGGSMTFWSERRDGKNALFIGDRNAANKQQLMAASEYKAYGWLSDKWVLLQKNDSELYIATPGQLKNGKEPLKISDYHKLTDGINDYGYGYGGL